VAKTAPAASVVGVASWSGVISRPRGAPSDRRVILRHEPYDADDGQDARWTRVDTAEINRFARSGAPLIAALCFVVTVGYGALFYGFSVLITDPAAGGEFSRGLLSAAYGGAVLTGGLAAIPVGRLADAHGVRGLIVTGALLGAGGLLAFATATEAWHVLAIWWLVLGPATALTFYEPAYVAIQQAFAPDGRALAIAALTLTAGLSGPIFVPATGALVDVLGWRDATRLLAGAMACAAPTALLLIPAHRRGVTADSSRKRRNLRQSLRPFREPRLLIFSSGAVLAYGATEAVAVHSVARFQELGFGLGTVTFWAGLSGLITLPGRFLLPMLARRVSGTAVLGGVLGVLALATSLMVAGDSYWQMVGFYVLFGVVFGAALPLRAIVMGEWTATASFGTVMGVQAALVAAGRAGLPALTGGLHDWAGDYTAAMALLSVVLLIAAALVTWSGAQSARFASGPPVVGGDTTGTPAPRPNARGARGRRRP
jgi:MFS family permease